MCPRCIRLMNLDVCPYCDFCKIETVPRDFSEHKKERKVSEWFEFMIILHLIVVGIICLIAGMGLVFFFQWIM